MRLDAIEVLNALVARIEELDNPRDEGIASFDPCVEAARKLIADEKAKSLMEWQSIASAPKDGSRVLAWRPNWDDPWFVRWIFNPRLGVEGWNDSEEMDVYCLQDQQPTHWLPIPEVPRE